MSLSYDQAIDILIRAGQRLDARGLAPATSGNFSVRLDEKRIAVTVSGRHKGRLTRDDVMLVSPEGIALENKKPSAETGLHTLAYKLHPHVNAVLHVHSVPGVTLTRHLRAMDEIVFSDYEMLKAFPGISTHETSVTLPIFENTQNIEALAQEVAHRPLRESQAPAYLIRGHGAYGWGKDMEEAERVIEALDHLLNCEIEALRLRAGVPT
jgi:methylthioribulose-1-phosphate dehydratase